MLIDHSTCSNAPACGGDKARETERSVELTGERGVKPLDCEDASPSESKLDSASLRKSQWPTFQMRRSLTSLEKQWSEASKELGGVVEESARQRRNRNIREGSPVLDFQRSEDRQRAMGNHNHGTGWEESSEWSIVAMKRGNACGANGPYCNNANINIGEAA
jgi:hypothetical protein